MVLKTVLLILGITFTLQACADNNEYELKKYYKDANSPAAILMGGTFAGVVSTFSSKADCIHAKQRAVSDDRKTGYTNSTFICEKK